MSKTGGFTDDQLTRIIGQGAIYECACPAQLASQIRETRTLLKFQRECLLKDDNLPEAHNAIITALEKSEAILEACLDEVLDLEGWDRKTLKMPDDLRKRIDEALD